MDRADSRRKKVVIAGASGLVGSAAMRYFAALPDWDVVGVSRHPPENLDASKHLIQHVSADLTDAGRCAAVFGEMTDVTHLIYAAVHEQPNVVAGWQAREQMLTNRAMLVNLFEPLEAASPNLRHVSLMQGTKAYGVHRLWPGSWFATPAREDAPRYEHDNFYWLQQDYLTAKQEGNAWAYTVWRPVLVFGDPVGSNLSVISVIGAYAALEREAGRPLSFPGGPPYPMEAVDVDLLARAMHWGSITDAARCEVFNVSNGDVFVWHQVWPVIASAFGMALSAPHRRSMTKELPARAHEWAALVDKYRLSAPRDLFKFIGGSTSLADYCFGYSACEPVPPKIVSTVKLRQAGFHEYMHTDQMFRKWIARMHDARLLPAPQDEPVAA